nr:[FeFe] hydrogenase H-cluster radical SAM maturase HydE [Kiritimatiellia bacterium]
RGGAIRERLAAAATAARRGAYVERVFIRALVEISSVCKNDCLYCGLRASNASAQRYRLKPDEIAACAEEGYALGFRTVVLQGGEDPFFTDAIVEGVIRDIKSAHPDMAVTLSLGERGRDSFARLREAGADRYLLRHETADAVHYSRLHPPSMSFANRMKCLADLKELGYQTGCGFMVGSPRQTPGTIAEDIAFIASFRPEMCGIGPFIPHHATPFAKEKAGTVEATCLLLSIVRLLHPHVLLPSTTALGTIDPEGREKGIRAGANVVMPNISPAAARGKYEIYDNKLCSGAESAQMLDELRRRVAAAGCSIAVDRGDFRP